MQMVSLKFVGGRPSANEVWDRKRYSFNEKNDFICDVPQKLANWLMQYAQGQYQVVPTKIKEVIVEVEKKPDLKCECGFVAKSEFGLQTHKRSHKKEE